MQLTCWAQQGRQSVSHTGACSLVEPLAASVLPACCALLLPGEQALLTSHPKIPLHEKPPGPRRRTRKRGLKGLFLYEQTPSFLNRLPPRKESEGPLPLGNEERSEPARSEWLVRAGAGPHCDQCLKAGAWRKVCHWVGQRVSSRRESGWLAQKVERRGQRQPPFWVVRVWVCGDQSSRWLGAGRSDTWTW